MLPLPVRLWPQKENVTTEAGKHTCTANASSRVVFAEDQLLHVHIRQDHALRRHALEVIAKISTLIAIQSDDFVKLLTGKPT